MSAITTFVQPELPSLPARSWDVEPLASQAIAGLRAPLETELTGIVDRLITRCVAETDAAVERARATAHVALESARAALEEQTSQNDGLTESLLQAEIQVEELRVKLQAECERTRTAMDAYDTEHGARQRAEEARDEAHALHGQTVLAYESRLRGVNAELDAARAELTGVKQQLEVEASERTRLIDAFRTFQQTCALVEPRANAQVGHTQDQPLAANHDRRAPKNDLADAVTPICHDETVAPTTDRHLKLVGPSEVAVAAPPQLLEYFKELFEQIDSMYEADQRTHTSVDVVNRLSANLRYARDVFVQRAASEGVNGAALFDQQLSVKLDEVSTTSLDRHLAIAAYELTQGGNADISAEAS